MSGAGAKAGKIIDAVSVVLLGGEARRMGSRDKARIVLGGVTLLERVEAALEPLFDEILLSAHTADYDGGGRSVVPDSLPGRGPALGVASTLAHIDREWLFVVSCDLPELSPDVVKLLAAEREGYDAVVPFVAGRFQASCAFYSIRCLEPLTAEVRQGRRSLARFLSDAKGLRVKLVSEDELRVVDPELKSFRDIDTPEELLEAEHYIKEI